MLAGVVLIVVVVGWAIFVVEAAMVVTGVVGWGVLVVAKVGLEAVVGASVGVTAVVDVIGVVERAGVAGGAVAGGVLGTAVSLPQPARSRLKRPVIKKLLNRKCAIFFSPLTF